MRKDNHQKGFTLIEMICVLLITGILSAIAGLGIVNLIQGYLFSKDNASLSAQTQVAMTRLTRELSECCNCRGEANSSIELIEKSFHYYSAPPDEIGARSIKFDKDNGSIELSSNDENYNTLLNNVSAFTMTYNDDGSITISIQSSKKPGGVTVPPFTARVFPRNSN